MNTLDTSSFLTFDQSVNLYQQFIEESVLVDKHLYNDLPENTQDILSNRQIIESNIDAIVSTETDMINNKLIPFILDKQSEPIGTINELVSHYEMSDEMMSLIMANRYPLEFYFDFDHFELDEKEMLTLRKFITTAKGYNGKVKIEGYTDNTGSEKYNFKLSRKRAQFVADLLILEGFPSENIVIVAKGESDPIASNKTNEGRRKNRRGVLRID
jgi:outer membrane protein OmpA-like peptidoglycan-associated protein